MVKALAMLINKLFFVDDTIPEEICLVKVTKSMIKESLLVSFR